MIPLDPLEKMDGWDSHLNSFLQRRRGGFEEQRDHLDYT